jgi:succinyl-CoA synthetase beta subunit
VAAAELDPDATEGRVDILLKLYRAYTEGDADLTRSTRSSSRPTAASTPSTPR